MSGAAASSGVAEDVWAKYGWFNARKSNEGAI